MPKSIVIFPDGTGQAGGINFDEARTNVYKLYRACRVGPDTRIDPAERRRSLTITIRSCRVPGDEAMAACGW